MSRHRDAGYRGRATARAEATVRRHPHAREAFGQCSDCKVTMSVTIDRGTVVDESEHVLVQHAGHLRHVGRAVDGVVIRGCLGTVRLFDLAGSR